MSRKYDELEQAAVLEAADEEQARKPRKRVRRLPHLPGHFVRVPIEWLKPYSPRKSPFDPPTRLYLFVLYKSHWGQKGVKLTSALAAEIGMSRRTKNRNLQTLERKGRVRVEREGRAAAIVWPIVLT